MSKEYLYHVRYTLDTVAQEAFTAMCLAIEEEMKSLEEVRDRFGSLDNYYETDASSGEPFVLQARLQPARITMHGSYHIMERLHNDVMYFRTSIMNLTTMSLTMTAPSFEGKKLDHSANDTGEDIETEDYIRPAVFHIGYYRDANGIFHSLKHSHEQQKIVYDGDTPYNVICYTQNCRPILTIDGKRQIVRCMNLWTREQKVYVFPCPPPEEDGTIAYLSYFFMFEDELYAFGRGKRIYHIPSNRLVLELGNEIDMAEVCGVIGDGRRLVILQHNRHGNTNLLQYDLSR